MNMINVTQIMLEEGAGKPPGALMEYHCLSYQPGTKQNRQETGRVTRSSAIQIDSGRELAPISPFWEPIALTSIHEVPAAYMRRTTSPCSSSSTFIPYGVGHALAHRRHDICHGPGRLPGVAFLIAPFSKSLAKDICMRQRLHVFLNQLLSTSSLQGDVRETSIVKIHSTL